MSMERHTTTLTRRYGDNAPTAVGEEIASIIAAEYDMGDTIRISIEKVD
jgi:hypothetical protein